MLYTSSILKNQLMLRFQNERVPNAGVTPALAHNLEIISNFNINNLKNLESPSLMIYKATYKSLLSIYTRIFAVLFYLFFTLNGLVGQDFFSSVLASSVFTSFMLVDLLELFEIFFGILHILTVLIHSSIGESKH